MKVFLWMMILLIILSSSSWAGTYLVMHPPGATFETPQYDKATLYGETVYTGMITMDFNGISYVIGVTDDTKVIFKPEPYNKPLSNGKYPEGYMLFKK